MNSWAALLVPPAAWGLGWLGLRWLRRELAPPRLEHPGAVAPLTGLQWVSVPTANGKHLAAQWLPGPAGRGVVILQHGWGGNGSQLRPAALALHRRGWSVLLPDARNHGRSDPDGHSSLPRFAEDLHACLDWLPGQLGEPAQPMVLMGHSLGAAAALLAGSQRSDVAAIVSVSAFAHPEQVMRRWLAEYRIPFWPLGWLVNRYIERVIGQRFDDIAPVSRIAHIQAPVLLVHGQDDTVVPLECAQRLQASAPHASLLVRAGRHDGFDEEDALYAQVSDWLDRNVPAAPPACAPRPQP